MKQTRVLIADDHPLSRKAIKSLLSTGGSFEIIGEAADGRAAVERAVQLMPDLILMDIRMPEINGLEAAKRIKVELPYVKIVILSVSNDVADFFEAIKYGAQGYLLKNMDPGQWLDYLNALVEGESGISRALAHEILQEFTSPLRPRSAQMEPESNKTDLSKRELEILKAVADGFTNKEIGEQLFIAENTVKNHLQNILEKLHLRNRAQLVSYAYDQGWLTPQQK